MDVGRHIHYSALDSRRFGRFDHLIQQKFRQQEMTCMLDSINNGKRLHELEMNINFVLRTYLDN